MKRVLVSAVALSLAMASAGSAHAENSSKEEMAGVGSGAVLGGLVGGPPGVVIGAAIGAVLGDKFHQKSESIDNLTEVVADRDRRLGDTRDQLASTTAEKERLQTELTELDQSGVRALYTALDSGVSFSVPFRTDDDNPESELVAQVNQVAMTLAEMPELGVQIDGFADARGGVEYNADLSLRRATAVRDLLIAAGIEAERIQTYGHGALTTYGGTDPVDLDELAMQRRVVVTFYRDTGSGEALAAQTDPSSP